MSLSKATEDAADEMLLAQLPRTSSKLSIEVQCEDGFADLHYFFRVALDCAPSPRQFVLMQIPSGAEIGHVMTHVADVGSDGLVMVDVGSNGETNASAVLAIRAARALQMPITTLSASSSFRASPRVTRHSTGNTLVLQVPALMPLPSSPPPNSPGPLTRTPSSKKIRRDQRSFIIALHATAKYIRSPPDDVHIVKIPRPYSLNNRIRVSASPSVLDMHLAHGDQVTMDLDPALLETGRRTHARRGSESDLRDAASTFRSGSEYGTDEGDDDNFIVGAFHGGTSPITIRWGPSSTSPTALTPPIRVDTVATASLDLSPSGRIAQPTHFEFVCTLELQGLHLTSIAKAGVVSTDFLFAHASERILEFTDSHIELSPRFKQDAWYIRSAMTDKSFHLQQSAHNQPHRRIASGSSSRGRTDLLSSSFLLPDDSDLLQVGPPSNLETIDGSIIDPSGGSSTHYEQDEWWLSLSNGQEKEDGCDLLLDAKHISDFNPKSDQVRLVMRGTMILTPHCAGAQADYPGTVSFTAPTVRVRQAQTSVPLLLSFAQPLSEDRQQSSQRHTPNFSWVGSSDQFLKSKVETPSAPRTGLTSSTLTHSAPPSSSTVVTSEPASEDSHSPSFENFQTVVPPNQSTSTMRNDELVWVCPKVQFHADVGLSGAVLCRLSLPLPPLNIPRPPVTLTFPSSPPVNNLTLSTNGLRRSLTMQASAQGTFEATIPSAMFSSDAAEMSLQWHLVSTSDASKLLTVPGISLAVDHLDISYQDALQRAWSVANDKDVVSFIGPQGRLQVAGLVPNVMLTLCPTSPKPAFASPTKHGTPPSNSSPILLSWKLSTFAATFVAILALAKLAVLQSGLAHLEHEVQLLSLAANVDPRDGSWYEDSASMMAPAVSSPVDPLSDELPKVDTHPDTLVTQTAEWEPNDASPAFIAPISEYQDHVPIPGHDDFAQFFQQNQDPSLAIYSQQRSLSNPSSLKRHPIVRVLLAPVRIVLNSLAFWLAQIAPPSSSNALDA